MTKTRQVQWWIYIVTGLAVIFFLVPTLVSARSDIAVFSGLLLLTGYGFVSWHFWIAEALASIKGKLS